MEEIWSQDCWGAVRLDGNILASDRIAFSKLDLVILPPVYLLDIKRNNHRVMNFFVLILLKTTVNVNVCKSFLFSRIPKEKFLKDLTLEGMPLLTNWLPISLPSIP
jgi:hypothetical protein